METMLMIACLIQTAINVIVIMHMNSKHTECKRRIQKQRGELLDLLHQHQEWMEVTQRQSTLQGLRNVRDDRTAAWKSLLQEDSKTEAK